jgi:hypothetical protein
VRGLAQAVGIHPRLNPNPGPRLMQGAVEPDSRAGREARRTPLPTTCPQ